MLKVTIELWPGGDKSKSKIIGVGGIANDGTGTKQTGNYVGVFEDKKVYEGKLEGFQRSLGPWLLLAELLKQIGLSDRQPSLLKGTSS